MTQSTLLSFFSRPVTSSSGPVISKWTDTITPKGIDISKQEKSATSEQTSILTQVGLDQNGAQDGTTYVIPHLVRAIITDVRTEHLPQLKTINSTLFPVKYSDKFFQECIDDPTVAALSKVLLYDSKPVGWIRCRLEPKPGFNGTNQVYIQTIGILAPFRGLGLATALLDRILQDHVYDVFKADCIYAHVWEANTDAVEWYNRRGFKMVLLVEQYYRRLKPSSAWILRKEIERK